MNYQLLLGFHDATEEDIQALSIQKKRVLMLVYKHWRTGRELIAYTNAAEATRRLRELRAEGFEILKRGSGRHIEYFWTGKCT